MSKVYQTLRKKNDTSVEIYPNIEPDENIPNNSVDGSKLKSNSITSGKLANSSVTNAKINDGAVTSDKLANNSVTNAKINDGAVTSSKIADGTIQLSNLCPSIVKSLLCLDYTYLLYMGNEYDTDYTFICSTTISNVINDYSQSDISSALDFDKNQADYTSTDLAILKLIIDGFGEGLSNNRQSVKNDSYIFSIYKSANYYVIQVTDWLDNVVFKLSFNGSTYTITEYINTEYIYIDLVKLINKNVNFE